MAKEFFFLAKVLAKVHVHMSKLHCRYLCIVFIMYIFMYHFVKTIGGFSRKFGESFAKALAKDDLHLKILKARWPKLWTCCVRTDR